jgi:hypothetical protein
MRFLIARLPNLGLDPVKPMPWVSAYIPERRPLFIFSSIDLAGYTQNRSMTRLRCGCRPDACANASSQFSCRSPRMCSASESAPGSLEFSVAHCGRGIESLRYTLIVPARGHLWAAVHFAL